MWQRVDDEGEEEREDGEDDKSDDELLELLPDEEDEGLHRVDEPGEACGGTTRGKKGDSLHQCTPGLSLQQVKGLITPAFSGIAAVIHTQG